MRLLVLSKRQYTGKDLLDDRYGRLYELPAALADRGHEVAVLVASYRPRGEMRRVESGVSWQSVDASRAPVAYWRKLRELIADFRPDVIWASSDALHVIGAAAIGRRFRIPTVVDFYDDYESFGLAAFPGLRTMMRRACLQVNAISVVSHALVACIRSRSPVSTPITLVENGVPPIFSLPIGRGEARRSLGLPNDVFLIGTAGALSASRGIGDLLKAFPLLRQRIPAVRLVVAGPRDRSLAGVLAEHAIDLGEMPHDRVPLLYAALDVGVVCNRDSAFGRACYPQKLAEMVASQLPVVASAVGEAARLLENHPACLYTPGNAADLSLRLEQQLKSPALVPRTWALGWQALAIKLEGLLEQAVRSSPGA